MSIWESIKGAFSGRAAPRDNGIYYYVQCQHCGDRIRVRFNPEADLQQEFGESGDAVGEYSVRKMVVDEG